MKHTPARPTTDLTFEELVSRAKASETSLSPAALDGMLLRFEARLNVEGAAQISNTAANRTGSVPSAARVGKLGAVGKALLGGAGIAAVAAFLYSATDGAPDAATDPTAVAAQQAAQAPNNDSPLTDRGAPAMAEGDPVTPRAGDEGARDTLDVDSAASDSRPKSTRAASTASRLTTRGRREAGPKSTATPGVGSQLAATPSAAVEPATEQSAVVAATSSKPAPALDTSLAQLERAERELRSGNPKAALTTLALPVVPSLSSRVEALRAVALCQSGQSAAGRRLGTQHLVRNPRSPYEQRLQRACGEL